MDYEYDHEEEEYAPRVLWGRIAFFAIVLLLAFFLGRCTKDAGVSQAEFQAESNKVIELASDNVVLKQQLEAAQSGGGGETDDGGGGAEPTEDATGEDGGQDEVSEEGETYTVQSGDTLTKIAEQFYGDPRKFNLIAEANNIESGDLRVGQELTIPPDD